MWYLQNPCVHVSRVQKRVSKIVNFKVQKVQKPELFDFTDTCPWSGDVMPSFCHTPYLWAIFLTNIMLLGLSISFHLNSGRRRLTPRPNQSSAADCQLGMLDDSIHEPLGQLSQLATEDSCQETFIREHFNLMFVLYQSIIHVINLYNSFQIFLCLI